LTETYVTAKFSVDVDHYQCMWQFRTCRIERRRMF